MMVESMAGIGAIVRKDFTIAGRRWQTHLLRALSSAAIGICLVAVYAETVADSRWAGLAILGESGERIAFGIAILAYVLVSISAPGGVVRGFLEEGERRTMELLVASPLLPREIVIGKTLAALGRAGVIGLAAAPFLFLAASFGGVEGEGMLAALIFIAAGGLLGAAIALLALSSVRSGTGILIATYATLSGYLTVPLLLEGMWWSPGTSPLGILLWANPLLGCIAALSGGGAPMSGMPAVPIALAHLAGGAGLVALSCRVQVTALGRDRRRRPLEPSVPGAESRPEGRAPGRGHGMVLRSMGRHLWPRVLLGGTLAVAVVWFCLQANAVRRSGLALIPGLSVFMAVLLRATVRAGGGGLKDRFPIYWYETQGRRPLWIPSRRWLRLALGGLLALVFTAVCIELFGDDIEGIIGIWTLGWMAIIFLGAVVQGARAGGNGRTEVPLLMTPASAGSISLQKIASVVARSLPSVALLLGLAALALAYCHYSRAGASDREGGIGALGEISLLGGAALLGVTGAASLAALLSLWTGSASRGTASALGLILGVAVGLPLLLGILDVQYGLSVVLAAATDPLVLVVWILTQRPGVDLGLRVYAVLIEAILVAGLIGTAMRMWRPLGARRA